MRSKGDDMPEPQALGPEQAMAIRTFLEELANQPELLVEYVDNRVAFLRNRAEQFDLNDEAQALLLGDNFARVHEVMKQASQPVRWLVIWII
jgi:hypothetical protein